MSEIKDYEIHITLSIGDFSESMGREPIDQAEFDSWAELAEKGLLNGHIDWDIIYKCTRDAMPCNKEGDITNRNCVRCTYPERYNEYEHYDEEDS